MHQNYAKKEIGILRRYQKVKRIFCKNDFSSLPLARSSRREDTLLVNFGNVVNFVDFKVCNYSSPRSSKCGSLKM
jgi:hypothetical protein